VLPVGAGRGLGFEINIGLGLGKGTSGSSVLAVTSSWIGASRGLDLRSRISILRRSRMSPGVPLWASVTPVPWRDKCSAPQTELVLAGVILVWDVDC
jgi:hypothetical protein